LRGEYERRWSSGRGRREWRGERMYSKKKSSRCEGESLSPYAPQVSSLDYDTH
jgi:hypothetical protein